MQMLQNGFWIDNFGLLLNHKHFFNYVFQPILPRVSRNQNWDKRTTHFVFRQFEIKVIISNSEYNFLYPYETKKEKTK